MPKSIATVLGQERRFAVSRTMEAPANLGRFHGTLPAFVTLNNDRKNQ
jgi:hypothetical protein